MTHVWLLILGLISLAIMVFMATGARVFHEFSHHELEQYCRARNRPNLFAQIVIWHDRLALGAETLQSLAATVTILSLGTALFQLGVVDGTVDRIQFTAAILLGTFVMLAGTSWVPWAVVRLWSAPFLFHTWRIWYVAAQVAWPLSIGVKVFGALFHRMAGRAHQPEVDATLEDEIRSIVTTGEKEGLLETDVREMIEGVIELDKRKILEIMTPRSRMDVLDVNQSWDEVLDFVIRAGRTRIPVYEHQVENIIGVLFVKDLLPQLAQAPESRAQSLRPLLRDAWFVPETKPVDDMLQEFLDNHNHLAICVDEYHSVKGVVTIEDVLEEIVGEIVDESDPAAAEEIVQVGNGEFEVLAETHIDVVNKQLGLSLPDPEDYDTIGGLVMSHLGEIPKPGKRIVVQNVRIEVVEANRRAIERVRLRLAHHHPHVPIAS